MSTGAGVHIRANMAYRKICTIQQIATKRGECLDYDTLEIDMNGFVMRILDYNTYFTVASYYAAGFAYTALKLL